MHRKWRNLHSLLDIFRYDFQIDVFFGDCFQEGAQKFDLGKTYFPSNAFKVLKIREKFMLNATIGYVFLIFPFF